MNDTLSQTLSDHDAACALADDIVEQLLKLHPYACNSVRFPPVMREVRSQLGAIAALLESLA